MIDSLLRPAVLLGLLAVRLTAGFVQVTDGEIVNDGGWCYGSAWLDFDSDGWPDLFVVNNQTDRKADFLYRNNRDGTFTKLLTGPVVSDTASSYGCAAADYDNDGNLDLFVAAYNENNLLYQNEGNGTFTRVLTGPVVTNGGRSTGCAWADYDRDGLLDLFVCNRNERNFLYHNEGSGVFTRVLQGEIANDVDNSNACAWADYDGDGDPDLLVANVQTPNCLYRNNGDGTFSKVTSGAIVRDTSFSAGASWADYDNDGDLDLLVPTGVLGMYYDLLYRNDSDSFTKVTNSPITGTPTWSGGSGWCDFDNDADLDLFIGGYDGPNRLYQNDGSGDFSPIDTGAIIRDRPYTMGSAWADYDNDGSMDLFTAKNNYFGGNNSLFRNQGGSSHWLHVRCLGTVSNRSAIGARLRLWSTIQGRPIGQTREISSQTGGAISSQSDLVAHFGLADAIRADSLVILWPSGIRQVLFDIAADQILTVTENQGAVSEPHPARIRVPNSPRLSAWPNPFSAATALRYSLAGPADIELAVFDCTGRIVRTLAHGPQLAGEYLKSWDGRDDRHRPVAPGVYLCRLRVDGRPTALRMLVLR